MVVIGSFTAMAQRTVTGTVSGEDDGTPVPGVNVVVKGSSTGTVTDIDGKYQVGVPEDGGTLVFSFIGLVTEEVVVGDQSIINMVMTADIKQLTEVVVTAIGVTREEKSLGYALQAVGGQEISQAREPNLVNALQGKIAGAQITSSSGAVGSSSRIILRGANSLNGNNQPLFVVDGVPISNSNFGGTANEGVSRGNGAADVNPEDIENISVLKGPNAAALYGSRASNGVILITTKSGKGQKGLGISISNTTTFENPLKLPDYQNSYGQGSGGAFAFVNGEGGGTNDGTDESWGPKLDAGLMIAQYDSPVDGNGVRQATPWISRPNNVKDFFETGVTSTTNVAITGGDEKSNFRASYTYLDQKGMVPNTDQTKNGINISGGLKPSKLVNITANLNYINVHSDNLPGYGYSAENVMQQFIWSGRQTDIPGLKDYANVEKGIPYSDIGLTEGKGIPGSKYNWNYNYHNNPYFTLYENLNGMNRDRLYGNVKVEFTLTDYLKFHVRSGGDFYSNINTTRVAKGDVDNAEGSYSESHTNFKEMNTDFLFMFNKKFGTDLDLSLNAGGNLMIQNYSNLYSSADELAVPGIYNVANSKVPLVTTNRIEEKEIQSLYFSGSIGWKNSLFLDFTGRNDWSSTLPAANNSYFYPSFSLSAVLTDLFAIESNVLSFAKLRGGWAKVGSDTGPYNLNPTLSFGDGWNASTKLLNLYVPNDLANAQLEPEFTTSLELGADFRFLNDRITLDLTYYDKSTTNQIVNIPISGSSGFTSKWVNAGEITNTGYEIMLGADILPSASAFKWNIAVNWSKNQSEVVSLPDGVEQFEVGSYWSLKVVHIPGLPYGQLFGYDVKRAPDGQILYDGGTASQGDLKALGSFTPDWLAGVTNTFRYKNFDASVLIDTRQGGSLYSMTTTWGRYAGVLEETVKGREGGIVGEGVKSDGEGGYVPNDVVVTAEEFNKSAFVNSVASTSIFNASYVKLREVRIGYNFKKMGAIKNLNLSFVGRNLALLASEVPHVDPETAFSNGNVQGLEFGQLPSARSLGFSVRVDF